MAASALVRALRGGRSGTVAAAMALGRRGLRGAEPSPAPLLMRRFLGTGGSGAGGGGQGAMTNSGGGGAANSGGCGGLAELNCLRKDVFRETRRLWDTYHERCEAQRKLFDELTRLEMERALNRAKAKVDLVFTIYKMLGWAWLFFFGCVWLMGPYVQNDLVHSTAAEVDKRIKLREAFAEVEEGDGKTAAAPTAGSASPAAGAPGAPAPMDVKEKAAVAAVLTSVYK